MNNLKAKLLGNKRTVKKGIYSTILTVVAIVLVVVVNLFTSSIPTQYTKYDMTDEGVFSLSEQTEQIVKGVDEDITIYLIASVGSEESSLVEFINRYTSLNSKIKLVQKDPVLYPNFTSNYTDEDVSSNSIIVESDKRSKYIAYSDIFVTEYSMNYTTYSYDTTSSFDGEQQLTSAIDYVTSDELPVVYTLSGNGEMDLSSISSSLESEIGNENIDLQSLSLLASDGVPEDAQAVIIAEPTDDITADELSMLEDYMNKGGNFVVLSDNIDSSLPNLLTLLNEYGVTSEDGVVIEGDTSYYYMYQSYLLPEIESQTITDPLIDNGYYAFLPFAQGIKIMDDAEDDESLTIETLLKTSDASYSKAAGFDMQTYEKESGDTDGPYYLGVAVTKTITSDSDDDTSETTSKLVYYSSIYMLADEINEAVSGANFDLFLNTLSWQTEKESSIAIRAKSLDSESLVVDAGAARNWEILMIGLVPIAILLGGGVVCYRRRKQ